jgi:hypothetical protein
VVWRKAGFTFDGESWPETLTFGVLGPELLDGPGGVFLGLIRDTDGWVRPSFLGQTGYSSFSVDLRRNPRLVLSKKSLIRDDDYIPLVRDLNRRYGAPVVHYAARASGFVVNGLPLRLDGRNPTYVIFDTGLSWPRRTSSSRGATCRQGRIGKNPSGASLRDSRRRRDRAPRRWADHDPPGVGCAVDAGEGQSHRLGLGVLGWDGVDYRYRRWQVSDCDDGVK